MPSQTLLEAVWEDSEEVLCGLDGEGVVCQINRPFPEFTAEEMLGKPFEHLLAPEARHRWREAWQKAAHEGEISQADLLLMVPHSSTWSTIRLIPVRSEGPFQVLVLATRYAPEHLTDHHLAELFELSSDWLYVATFQGRLTMFNPAMQKALGYTKEQLLNTSFFDFIHPDDQYTSLAAHTAVETGEIVHQFLNRVRFADGKYHWIEWTSVGYSERQLLYGVARDVTARLEAAHRLAESEARWRALSECSPDFIMVLSAEGRIEYLNRVDEGQSFETFLGNIIADLSQDASSEEFLGCMRRVQEHGGVQSCLVKYVLPGTSSPRTFHCRMAPMRLEAQPEGLIVACSDVTDHQRLRELYDEAQVIANVGGWEFDTATGKAQWTDQVYRIHELPLGTPVEVEMAINFYHEDSRAAIRTAIETCVETGEGWDLELKLVTARGDVRWVRAIGKATIVGDRVVRLSGTFQDIQKRKTAEVALRHSEQRLRLMMENLPAGAVRVAPDGIELNQAAEKITGYLRSDLCTVETWFERLFPGRREAAVQLYQDAKNAGFPDTILWNITRADGQPRTLEFSAYAFKDDEIWLLLDITDRLQAEQQLHEHREQLAHVTRLTTLGEMVAGIAHEISQPLAAISNYAGACTNALRDQEPAGPLKLLPNWIQQISQQSVKCGEIIRGLRMFTKQTDQQRNKFDLNDLVVETLQMLEFTARQRAVEVHFEKFPSPVRVSAVQVQIQQVLVNLVRNAYEALSSCERPRLVNLQISVSDEGDWQVTVDDNGPGCSAEDLDQMFRPFWTTKTEGLGMGLAMSSSLIEVHGGRLWVEPKDDPGARFCFTLPQA